jgi:hypothetical protein
MRRIRLGGAVAVSVLVGESLVGSASAQTINLWPGVAPGSLEAERDCHRKHANRNNYQQSGHAYPDAGFAGEIQGDRNGHHCGAGRSLHRSGYRSRSESGRTVVAGEGHSGLRVKYRLQERKGEGIPPDLNVDEACKYGIADGIQAMKVVRQHAA